MGIPIELRASSATAQEQRFRGELDIDVLERLRAELLSGAGGPLKIDVQADQRQGWPRLHGRVEGALRLECRSCGKPFDWPLRLDVELRLVAQEDDERTLLSEVDPYWVRDDRLMLRELLEDEILLALPMFARCETCENALRSEPSAKKTPEPDATPKADNPFTALREQLKRHKE